jgi:hypothetical protein
LIGDLADSIKMISMGREKITNTRGSVMIMAAILAMVITLLGVSFLSFAFYTANANQHDLSYRQAAYNSQSGAIQGLLDIGKGRINLPGWKEFYQNNYYDYEIIPAGISSARYGFCNYKRVVGKGVSRSGDASENSEIILVTRDQLSFADFVYLSHRERDSLRHEIPRFWTPDTLDGLVHSNDTIHLSYTADGPVFLGRVTTSANYIDPPNNHARFLEGWGFRPPITFPDNIDNLLDYSGYDWGTQGPDSLTQIVLSGDLIRMRKCGLRRINNADSICCYPMTIAEAPAYPPPSTGVIAITGKVWISASRGRVDFMDGEVPQRSHTDGGFISEGFSGRLTIASTDTMVITDNLVYMNSKPDFSVPSTLDSCSDILGLVSGRYVMIGKDVSDTVYINAAMAALCGSISVQDIYMNHGPGWDNEKQSLVVYGSLAQRNRGIMHCTDYPPAHLRGFIEKDYHYDHRFTLLLPPHFPLIGEQQSIFLEASPKACD